MSSTLIINENTYTLTQFATSTVSGADALVLTIDLTDVDLDTLFADFNAKDEAITIDDTAYEGYVNFEKMIVTDKAEITLRQNTSEEIIKNLETEVSELQLALASL